MSLKKYTASLTEKHRFGFAIELIEKLLPIWNDFSKIKKNLEYIDTVVVMYHVVDKNIIERTIKLAKKWIDNEFDHKEHQSLNSCFSDPIVALQDLDWEIPENIQLIFYSAYNLLIKLNGETKTIFGDEQLHLVINQAIDSIFLSELMTENELREFMVERNAPIN
ncbi:MAG: hypothetical protein ACPGSD_13445 [Flavobacteriales bacterium]